MPALTHATHQQVGGVHRQFPTATRHLRVVLAQRFESAQFSHQWRGAFTQVVHLESTFPMFGLADDLRQTIGLLIEAIRRGMQVIGQITQIGEHLINAHTQPI